MSFNQVLESAQPTVVNALVSRAIVSTRVARVCVSSVGRRRLYEQKNAAVSRLITLGAVRVEGVSADGALVSMVPTIQPFVYLRAPLSQLTPDAQRIVTTRIAGRALAA